jgi:glycosidase
VKKNPQRAFVFISVLISLFAASVSANGNDDACDDLLVPPASSPPDYLNKNAYHPGQLTLYNPKAAEQVLYEVQVRAANAFFKKEGSFKMGTFEDMLKSTTDYHDGITIDYIRHRMHATMMWMMPAFPNNAKWSLPSPVDTLGSPYAVRDYMHMSGLISEDALKTGRYEFSYEEKKQDPVWGDSSFDKVIKKANEDHLGVMLDMAFNHFGHNHNLYTVMGQTPIRERVASGQDLDELWNFEKTFEPALVHPQVLDTLAKLDAYTARDPKVAGDLAEFKKRAPDLEGDDLVRGFNMWRVMTDSERARYNPAKPNYLEYQVPGFYRGANVQPSLGAGDNFTNNWQDVKFLYLHEKHGSDWQRGDYYETYVRNREHLFEVMNYWVSKGVRGFRLDHATDADSGISPNFWKYVIGKTNYYDWIRQGKPAHYQPPVYMAEEFGDQMGMSQVVDMMTDGYVGDIRGQPGSVKDTSFIESKLENENRFQGRTLVMRALETHDESRLFDHGTGFDIWSGAAFYAIGASSHGVPMALMGQEFGEPWGLAFRGEDSLRSRFRDEKNHHPQGQALVDFYGMINRARTDPTNRALLSPNHAYLQLKNGGGNDHHIFAQVKWDHSQGSNVVFTFVKPWDTSAYTQHYSMSSELGDNLLIRDRENYRLVNAFTGLQEGGCVSGGDLKRDFQVHMNGVDRVRWLRLELCQ